MVLPAPFGPISAVMAPRWISTCSTSTAVRPPNCRTTLSATRIGSGFGAPGLVRDVLERSEAASLRSRRVPVAARPGDGWAGPVDCSVDGSAGIERDLPPVAEDALRPEDHQQHEQQPDQHEPDLADLGVVDDDVEM